MAWLISVRRLALHFVSLTFLILPGLILAGCQSGNRYDDPRAHSSPQTLEFSPEARLRVATKLRAAGDYMSALRMYQDVIDKDPKNLEALSGQAELYLELGAPQQAAALYEAALMVLPNEARLQAGFARALTELGRGDEAIPYFEKALAKGESSAKIHNHYGVALDLAGRHGDAQVQYGMALDKSSGDLAAMNNLALSLALSEDYPAAVRLLSDIVTAAPNAALARRNLALVYALSGDMNAAQTMIRFPDNPAAEQSMQSYINHMLKVPKALRAKAVFAGLDAVADQMPPEEPATAATAAVADPAPPQRTTPSVIDVTTRPSAGEALPPAAETAPAAGPPVVAKTDQPARPQSYFVQLGAYPTEQLAQEGWKKMALDAPTILEGRTPVYYPADGMVRLGLAASDRQTADDLCAALKSGGLNCLVRRTSAANTP